ncbi:MAG: DUF1223 domain-containing protein [bacterium]|nr:DUF1223 domain-containing protein [bacterium]
MKRYFPFIIAFLLLARCADLDRDNPLDPKNPGSETNRAILVELFINDSTGFEYCNFALDAIEKLSQREEFKNNLFVLEYHLTNRNTNWNDGYARDEFNQRYYEYVPLTSERGIPDALFNGALHRIQGASQEKIEERYASAASSLAGQKSYFHIEAEKKIAGNVITVNVNVARYGTSNAENIDLNVILYEDLKIPRYRFLARKIFQKQTIPSFGHGEVKSFIFSEPLSDIGQIDNLFVIIMVQAQNGASKEIFQVARF